MAQQPEEVVMSDTSRPADTAQPDAGDIDGISLRQALLDVEVANARVIDLTRRLTLLNGRLIDTTTELETMRMRNRIAEAELARISVRGARLAARVAKAARSRVRR